jgi:hypothetical protein
MNSCIPVIPVRNSAGISNSCDSCRNRFLCLQTGIRNIPENPAGIFYCVLATCIYIPVKNPKSHEVNQFGYRVSEQLLL